MIREQWYVVLESNQVGNKPISALRLGEKMVFWRDGQGVVRCAVDRCPHRGAALSKGSITNNHLQCPFHGFEFNAQGMCVHIPANGRGGNIPKSMRLQSYPTYEEHGFIWIWWGDSAPKDKPEFFDNIGNEFQYTSVQDAWNTHYSRVIENQLDVAHLPFIHKKTIGRGGRTVVDGPLVEWHGEKLLYTYVFNRKDDGTPARKPSELSAAQSSSVHLEFIMPNLWQNYISENVRILIAFVPVDNDNTLLYLRFYQKTIPIPLVGKIFTLLAMPMNIFIAHEDRYIVETQEPKASGLKIGEILIQGDLPIIEYRRRRAELQAKSNSYQKESKSNEK